MKRMAELLLDAREQYHDWDDDSAAHDERHHNRKQEEEEMQQQSHRQRRPRDVQQQYPLNVTVDFTKLRANALRRYMAFHGIQEIPGSSKDQLAIVVARHFNDQCKRTDEETSIASFLTYIKTARAEAEKRSDNNNNVAFRAESEDEDAVEQEEEEDANQIFSLADDTHDSRGDHGDDTDNNTGTSSPSSSLSSDDEDDDDNVLSSRRDDATKAKQRSRSGGSKSSRTAASSSSSSTSAGKHSSTKPSSSLNNSNMTNNTNNNSHKKRKTQRLYCVCHGLSFGNMIACDNKKCMDRSNWYHMSCVDLDPTSDPPETWFCPSCVDQDAADLPEHQYRKPVASVTYSDMISHALTALPARKGSFKEICDFVETQYESQLNWKLESDQRKSPVWKSSVRKILFSNVRFRKHPDDKGLFCLAA